jgi:hypothetical protein
LDQDNVPDAYHETREDLRRANTEEERAFYQARLDEINDRVNEEGLDPIFTVNGCEPRYEREVPMEEEPENLDPSRYVERVSYLESRMNDERDPDLRRQLREERDRIYGEAEANDLTDL